MGRFLTVFFVVALFSAGYIWGHQSLNESHQSTQVKTEALRLPDAEGMASASLNYRTFGADLAWVLSLVGRGEDVRKKRTNGYYLENGLTLSKIDPFFRRSYNLFPAIYLASSAEKSHEELMRVADFYDVGLKTFPTDANLLTDAGLVFVGYSAKHQKRDRLEQLKRASIYFTRATNLNSSPDLTAGLVGYCSKRIKELSDDSENATWSLEDRDLLTKLFLNSTDESFRSFVRVELTRFGVDADKLLEIEQARLTRLADLKTRQKKNYIHDGLFWTFVEND